MNRTVRSFKIETPASTKGKLKNGSIKNPNQKLKEIVSPRTFKVLQLLPKRPQGTKYHIVFISVLNDKEVFLKWNGKFIEFSKSDKSGSI